MFVERGGGDKERFGCNGAGGVWGKERVMITGFKRGKFLQRRIFCPSQIREEEK